MTVSTLTKVVLTGGDIKQLKASFKGHRHNKKSPISNYVKFEIQSNTLTVTHVPDYRTEVIQLAFPTISDNRTFLFPIDVIKHMSVKKDSLHEFVVSDDFNAVNHIENGISQTHAVPDHEEFPKTPFIEKEYNELITFDHHTINKLNIATLSTSKSETRPVLQTVLIRNNSIYSTDSHRLFMTPTDIALDQDLLLPAQLVTLIHSLTDKEDTVTVSQDRDLLKLHNNSFTIYYDNISYSKFPDVSRLLPVDFNLTFDILEFDKFKKTLEAIKKLDKNNPVVRFNINNGQLELSSYGGENTGKIVTNINIHINDWSGTKDMVFCCNASYTLDALKQINTKSPRFNMVSNMRPFTVTDTSNTTGELALILPVRTF